MPRAKGDPGRLGADYRGRANELCFRCDKAFGGCSWSKAFIPIPGWTAEPSRICVGGVGRYADTYHITACPEFSGELPKERLEKDQINIRLIESEVRRIRHELKLTYREMEQRMPCSEKILRTLEEGEGSKLSAGTLLLVADGLGLDLDEIEIVAGAN